MAVELRRLRPLAAALLLDWPRYALGMARGNEYLEIRNRGERLEAAPDRSGFRCDWQWSSDLRAPRILPVLGRNLLRRAFAEHPVERRALPATRPPGARPDVSFVIGHRGEARLPLLLATLESIAAQRGAAVECIVVEQDWAPRLEGRLPSWVKLTYTKVPEGSAYCRSATFNTGAELASAPVLILHDNDMLAPADYAAEVLARVSRGYDVVNLKRFVFYLSAEQTRCYLDESAPLAGFAPEAITQNLEGGGTLGITREAFARIGGMDESFVGWGGEDNDLWERAQTLRVWPWANLPYIHLWHEPQAGKHNGSSATRLYHDDRAGVEPRERIARLLAARDART